MDAETLAAEIDRIAGLMEIEHEPAIQDLWQRCKAGGFAQRKPMLRELVKSQANAPREAEQFDAMAKMNTEYFVLNLKGKVRIGHFTSEQMIGHSRRILNLMSQLDFKLWMAGNPEAELWLNHPSKRKFTGLMTDPDKPPEWQGKLNLWAGFGIVPGAGDVNPFLDYVLTILAQGQQAWADYILNWLARVLQNPGQRIGVCLCLISAKEGTGKGTLGNLFLTIFGQHGRSVTSSENLLGHFNAHLADALFVFADEALFAGDLRGADKFKSTITEPFLAITPKGVDSIEVENRLSILMATNHNWAATVGWSDRRFAMFEVSEEDQTRIYWDGLHNWLTSGGKHIVLDFLLRRDLTGFHPVDSRPLTPVYLDQRRQSLRDTHRWWHEVLEAESFGTDVKGMALMPMMPMMLGCVELDKKRVFAAYKLWHKETQNRAARAASDKVFWKDFKAMTFGLVPQHRFGPRGEQKRVIVLPMSEGFPDWEKLNAAFEEWLSK